MIEEGADGEPEPVQSPGVPEYEQQRLQIIARNRQRMQELGLQQLAAEIMPKEAQPKPRSQSKGLAAKRKAVRTPMSMTRSKRLCLHVARVDFAQMEASTSQPPARRSHQMPGHRRAQNVELAAKTLGVTPLNTACL